MKKTTLEEMAEMLRERRKVCLQEFRAAESELQTFAADRESETEESAQEDRSARLLSALDDHAIHEVEEIDAALERIANGIYGKCQACAASIPVGRLRLLPATRYCVPCAKEGEQPARETQAELGRAALLPGDLSFLSDGEVAAEIHRMVKEDGRVDTEELRVRCRHGVVYLYGFVPSEKEHGVLLGILTDVLGLREVVDHIGVDEVLWERGERWKERGGEKPRPWEEPQGTEDIIEMEEEGMEYTPPDRPVPEEE